MNKSMKVIALALATIGLSISTSSFAVDYAKAEKQLKAVKYTETLEVGMNVSDKIQGTLTQQIQKIIPVSNLLSQKSGMNIVIVPERTPATFKNQIRSLKYPVLYVNPELASVAVEMGYKPLYKTSKTIDSVLLARSDAQINNWLDLYGMKVSVVPDTLIKTIADAALYKTGTIGLVDYTERKVKSQSELLSLFEKGVDDVVVVRGSVAKSFVDKNPGKYKVVLRAGQVPSFILLAHPDLSDSQKDKLVSAFLETNKPENQVIAETIENDGEQGLVKTTDADFVAIKEVMKIVEPDYSLTKAPAAPAAPVQAQDKK